jgi:integrase
MASLTRKHDCKNWIANITMPDGTRTSRSTGTDDKKQAQTIADTLEEATRRAKKGQFVEKDARAALNEILRRANEDVMNGDTVEDFLREWLQSKDNAGTNERYTVVVDSFLNFLGSKSKLLLSKVTHKDAQGFIKVRKGLKLASKTLRVEAKILSGAFNHGKRLHFIDENPFEKALAIAPIKVVSSTRMDFTPEQVSAILESAQGDWKTVILFGYFTGARLEDCASMKWSNVHFNKGVIDYIESKRGKRVVIPMSSQLEEHLQTVASTDSTDPHITPSLARKESGGKSGLSEKFKKIMMAAGVDPQTVQGQGKRKFSKLSFHSLRHTTNTLLANNGIDQETRMVLIGQTTKAVNSDYTHLDLKKLRGAVAMLPQLKIAAKH